MFYCSPALLMGWSNPQRPRRRWMAQCPDPSKVQRGDLPDLPDLGGPLGHFSVVRTCRCWFWYDMVNQLEFQKLVYFTALKVGWCDAGWNWPTAPCTKCKVWTCMEKGVLMCFAIKSAKADADFREPRLELWSGAEYFCKPYTLSPPRSSCNRPQEIWRRASWLHDTDWYCVFWTWTSASSAKVRLFTWFTWADQCQGPLEDCRDVAAIRLGNGLKTV